MISVTGKNLKIKGFSLTEVLITLVILTGGIVFVFRSFVSSMNAAVLSRNITVACYLAENKLWEAQENFKKQIDVPDTGADNIGGKEYRWGYTLSDTDLAGLKRIDLNIFWKEKMKEKEYNLPIFAYLP